MNLQTNGQVYYEDLVAFAFSVVSIESDLEPEIYTRL